LLSYQQKKGKNQSRYGEEKLMAGRRRGLFLFVMVSLSIILLAGGSTQLVAQSTPPGRQLATDPFYLKVFEEARANFDRGNYKKAFEDFKIAAFGLLDEPDLLGQAYVYLTVSAYQLGQADQVEHYLDQISRLKLFGRISASALPKEVKDKFKEICESHKLLISG
jgi:hypothetical protein